MIRFGFIAFFIVVTAHGCAAAPTARVDFDEAHDFAAYQTFSWHSENPMRVGKTSSQPRSSLQPSIMAAIRSNLESSGYRYVTDASAADFAISFAVGSREKTAPTENSSASCGQGAVGGWSTAFCGGLDGTSYVQGVLAIDIFDASERRQVWHGVAGRLIPEEDREDMRELIDSVVAEILSDFPPK